MKKPTLYLDTSIVSAFWYDGSDVAMIARRLHTRDWWDLERRHFATWTSVFSETELGTGFFARQRECVRMVRRLRYLTVTAVVRDTADAIIGQKIVPPNKPSDAAHLAITAIHGVDYLLTWNYAHMANPNVQRQFDKMCQAAELVAPLMVSPESIPQVRFGQAIGRK